MFDFIVTCESVDDAVILTTLAELENSEPYPYASVSAEARSLAPALVGQNRTNNPKLRAKFARALRERTGLVIFAAASRSFHLNVSALLESGGERHQPCAPGNTAV